METNKPVGAESVEAYLEALPPDRRAALSKLRELIREVAPRAEEVIQYGMPTFTLGGGPHGVAFASQKHYMSLYVDAEALSHHQDALRLRGIDLGKGCIRFRRYEALPLEVVRVVVADSFGVPAGRAT